MKDLYRLSIESSHPIQYQFVPLWRANLPHSELLLIGGVSAEMKPILAKYADCFRYISHVPNV